MSADDPQERCVRDLLTSLCPLHTQMSATTVGRSYWQIHFSCTSQVECRVCVNAHILLESGVRIVKRVWIVAATDFLYSFSRLCGTLSQTVPERPMHPSNFGMQ